MLKILACQIIGHWKSMYSNRTVSNSNRTTKNLTVLIEYIDLFYKILFHMLGFIVYASDTYCLPTKHGNWGINIRELLKINEHNRWSFWAVQHSIMGKILSIIGISLSATTYKCSWSDTSEICVPLVYFRLVPIMLAEF